MITIRRLSCNRPNHAVHDSVPTVSHESSAVGAGRVTTTTPPKANTLDIVASVTASSDARQKPSISGFRTSSYGTPDTLTRDGRCVRLTAGDDSTVTLPRRSSFDAKPLDAEEYRELLATHQNTVLRVSDGTGDGTYRFWMEGEQLYWRCLNWTAPRECPLVHLSAVLEDGTTQLLIERDGGDDER